MQSIETCVETSEFTLPKRLNACENKKHARHLTHLMYDWSWGPSSITPFEVVLSIRSFNLAWPVNFGTGADCCLENFYHIGIQPSTCRAFETAGPSSAWLSWCKKHLLKLLANHGEDILWHHVAPMYCSAHIRSTMKFKLLKLRCNVPSCLICQRHMMLTKTE